MSNSNFERKPNTGSLFKNDKKTTDSHPNATGRALIDGKEYYISSWTNKLRDGSGFYQSLRFTLVTEANSNNKSNTQNTFNQNVFNQNSLYDEDIPF